MTGKECISKGIYGIKDTKLNKIVYVGSTNTSFITRFGQHIADYRRGLHCNKRLSKLFESGEFDFVILEIFEGDKRQLLDRERYYTSLYNTNEKGFNINVGGSILQPEYKRNINYARLSLDILIARDYINAKYRNKRLTLNERQEIITYLSNECGIKVDNKHFLQVLRELGFKAQRMKTKRDWMIY